MKCPFSFFRASAGDAASSGQGASQAAALPESIGQVLDLRADGAVATLTLQRPERFNALDSTLIAALNQALDLLLDRDEVRTVVLTGTGHAFCSGADLAGGELKANPTDDSGRTHLGEQVRDGLLHHFNPLIQRLVEYPKATVCAVNGIAAGGGIGLALACDIVLAGRSASFRQVFAPKLGLVPDCGLTWQLPRTVGRARATAMALLGETLTADEAERLGLIWRVVDDAMLFDEAQHLAQRLASNPLHINHLVKRALRDAYSYSLSEQLRVEADLQGRCAAQPSFVEGVAAFREKREPIFHPSSG